MTPDLDVHLYAVQLRDAGAFAKWMAGAEGALRASLRSFASAVDVEAVLQEALVRVWTVAPRFEPDGRPNALLRFSLRVARNLAVSEVRRMRARPLPDDELERAMSDDGQEDVSVTVADPLLREKIADCTERLPPQPSKVLLARLEGGEDDATLAERLGMRLNTFLQNFGRARKLLAECLSKHGVTVAPELAR